MVRHRSSATPLALLFAALIAYASLYPFSDWRLPGVPWLAFLGEPWSHWWTWFDLVANWFGYMPLGALVFIAQVRTGARRRTALVLALLAGLGLSFAMEFLQNFLPNRVASNVDLGLNVGGALMGATAGALIHARGGVERWQSSRDRWFIGRSSGGLALLLLWPFGLLFPLPVPLGVGQVWQRLQDELATLTQGLPIEWGLQSWAQAVPEPVAMSPTGEFWLVALGLLAPCLVAFAVTRPGWRRAGMVLLLLGTGVAATTLSTALNFGPQHALAWGTPLALQALGAGAVAAIILSYLPYRVVAGLGLVTLAGLVALVVQAPSDPYFSQSLQAWEQGRFVRFHGAARWVGWLWPYAATIYLLVRLGARDEV